MKQHYFPINWGYIFQYFPADKAVQVCIGPVENSAMAALGITRI